MASPTAGAPVAKKKGMSGRMAPIEKRKKEAPAALLGDPPSAEGSSPSSSRTMVSRAFLVSAISRPATSAASVAESPLAS